MSRSGYSEDYCGAENYPAEFFYRAVKNSISGKRGQKFLHELAREMDAMPEKRLIEGDLIDVDGECCAMGVICKARGIDVVGVDETDAEYVGNLIGIAPAMAREIAFENDDDFSGKTEPPEARWLRMREWVSSKLNDKP